MKVIWKEFRMLNNMCMSPSDYIDTETGHIIKGRCRIAEKNPDGTLVFVHWHEGVDDVSSDRYVRVPTSIPYLRDWYIRTHDIPKWALERHGVQMDLPIEKFMYDEANEDSYLDFCHNIHCMLEDLMLEEDFQRIGHERAIELSREWLTSKGFEIIE